MSQPLTFASFGPAEHGLAKIYSIGADEAHPQGVAQDIATAFNYTLSVSPNAENLGGLVERIGSAEELPTNIAGIQGAPGASAETVAIARGWAQRSGLFVPVDRRFTTAQSGGGGVDLVIVASGMGNWTHRRVDRLAQLAIRRRTDAVLFIAGTKQMQPAEGADAFAGMTEADYMTEVVAPKIKDFHTLWTEVLQVDSGTDDEIMQTAAARTRQLVGLRMAHVAVVSAAGAWVQNGGQFRRAARVLSPGFDSEGDQLEVVSDSFELETDAEQDLFAIASRIAGNLQELTRHARRTMQRLKSL